MSSITDNNEIMQRNNNDETSVENYTNNNNRFQQQQQTRTSAGVARLVVGRGGEVNSNTEIGGSINALASGTATMTINDIYDDGAVNSYSSGQNNPEILSLTLRGRPSVTWDENVIDNENMGKKSSKRCCIFHKTRAFDESSTDTSDYDSDRSLSSAASAENGSRKKQSGARKKIARPKQQAGGDKKKKAIPDYQKFHA